VRSECLAAGEILGISKIVFRELPAACLDNVPAWQVNRVVADLVAEISPQELYIPFEFDLHKDHAAIAYAAYVAARPYLAGARSIRRLMAYETLSETHLWPAGFAPAFQPNVFVSIEKTLEKKLAAMSVYKSQLHGGCSPRSLTALTALARLRGAHVGSEAAEGFMLLGEYLR
jgi:LmbE family N-acetylglucosaminyl deacetylase